MRPHRLGRHPLVRVIRALDPDPGRTLLAVLLGTAALASAIGLMATSAWLISRAAQQPPVLHLQVAIVATRAFGLGRGVLRYAERLVGHDVALRGMTTLRTRLYASLAEADPAVVTGLRRGDLLARLGADVDTLADLVVRSLLPIAVTVTTVSGGVALVAWLLPPAGAAVATAMLLAGVLVPWLAARAARRAEVDGSRARTELSAEVLTVLDGAAELRVAGALPHRLARVDALDAEQAAAQDAAARSSAGAIGVSTLLTGVAMLAGLLLALSAAADGRLDPVLVAVLALTPLAAAEAVAALPAATTHLVRAHAAAARVLDLLDAAAPDSEPAEDAAHRRPDRTTHAVEPTLRAHALVCGHPPRPPAAEAAVLAPSRAVDPRTALDPRGEVDPSTALDLDLSPGRRVAIVGASGSGKTTLLLTLAGLLPPRAGHVTLSSGVDEPVRLAEVPEATLRGTVHLTAEDAHLFTTTVRENLRLADPDADDPALGAVLRRVGLADWLGSLPRGLDTVIGSGGRDVSGGERRRLLLARALLSRAPVLLVDEPAEHLDPAGADALVTELLTGELTACPETSVVMVTHRLTPLAAADEVMVLAGGRLVARGPHEWLVGHHTPYARALMAESARG